MAFDASGNTIGTGGSGGPNWPGDLKGGGSAVNDIFGYFAHKTKAKGFAIEEANYKAAAGFARQNAVWAKQGAEMNAFLQQRQGEKTIGEQEAQVGGAGLASSGSALDLLRDSHQEAALHHAMIQQQGSITVLGYEEQAKSYESMAAAAAIAHKGENFAATGSIINAGVNAAMFGAKAVSMFI